MTIVNPNNTTHTISVVPRFDITSASEDVATFVNRVTSDSGVLESEACLFPIVQTDFITVIITDSFKDVSAEVDNAFDLLKGKLVIDFNYDFRSEGRYKTTITYTNTGEVIYRGILTATTQEPQEYRLTKDKFYY